jgi:NAD(P)-dependent dehydrogenase (short-subunit alcohol dehydrogenase family)
LQISSIGGQIAFPGLGIYNATKFGLEAISQALAGELAPHGIIKVTIVEPGGMRTDWAGRSMAYTEPRETYTETVGPLRQMLRQAAGSAVNSGLSDPRRVATALIAVVESDDPPLRLPLGSDALEGIRRKLAHQQAELDRWAELSRSTDFTAASRTGTTSRRRACEAAS